MSFSSNEFACGPDVCVGKTDRVRTAYKILQQQLRRHGAPLKADGIIGKQTLTAARRALGDEAIAMAEIAEEADTLAAELAKLPVTYPKWGLVLLERSRGSLASRPFFVQAADEIPGQVVLRAATVSQVAANPPVAAQSLKGLIDLLVIVTIDTAFAGKAGEFRYWFEGTGSILGFKTSNGSKIIDHQEKTAITGVGEAATEGQARLEVSRRLATALGAGLNAFRSSAGAGAGSGSYTPGSDLPAFSEGESVPGAQSKVPWGWILVASAVVTGVGIVYVTRKRK